MLRRNTVTRTIRAILILLAILLNSSGAVAQTYKVRLIAESPEGKDVVNAVEVKLRANSRYALTDESKVDFTLNVECASQVQNQGFICATSTFYWGQSVFPLPAPISEISLFRGPNAASVAESVSQAFVSQTTEENIALITRALHEWVTIFCRNPANKGFCQP